MLATNLPVYFTSSSLYHRVALILITNSMSLWIAIATLRVIGAVDFVMWLFVTSCSEMMYHPTSSSYLAALAVSSSPITPHSLNEDDWVCLPSFIHGQARIHRYSKLTFPFSFLQEWRLHLFTASLAGSFLRQLHLLLSFPPQKSIIIFFSSTWDYACLTGCLAWYFHCIVSRHFPRPSNLYLHFSDGKTIHWRMPCLASIILAHWKMHTEDV